MEKFGKTSLAAQIPGCLFAMPAEETGLQTLIDNGLVKETPYLPPFEKWEDWLDALDYLTDSDEAHRDYQQKYGVPLKCLPLDTGNGFEKLCHEFICKRDYGGRYDKQGFLSYMQGYEAAIPEWKIMLAKLDKLRDVRKVRPVILCHTRIKNFKNPEGSDYDRYMPAMHEKTWEVTHRWADVILFGNFFTDVAKDGARAKGVGGQQRQLYTVRHAAYDAGNRLGLTDEIDCGSSAADAWENFVAACKAAKGGA